MTLPDGFRVRLRDDVRRLDGDRVLVGGSPLRMLRLSDRAAAVLDGGHVTVADAASRQVADRLLGGNLAVPVPVPVLGPPGAADLTVVIPIRDRADRLDRLLAHLGGALPVVVVDDASHDPTSIARVARVHGATLIALGDNVGPAGARNAGLGRVDTTYVAFVDSDVVVDADVLVGLAGHFADPSVAAVAPRVRGTAVGPGARAYERWDAAHLSLDLGAEPASVQPWSTVGYVPSACLLARVSDLGAGFDATLRVGEDVDLVWRLCAAGRRVRYDPAYVARHDSRSTWTAWLRRRFDYGTSGAPLAARHGDLVAPAVLSPALGVATLAVLVQRWWSAPVALACVGLTRRRLTALLPSTPDGRRAVRALTVTAASGTTRQTCRLVLRHWWPLAAVSLLSRRGRRVVLAALVWDAVEHRASGPDAFVARRVDDLAYGAGLWWGALRAGSVGCLRPRLARGSSAG